MLTKNSGKTNLLKAFFDIWNLLSWFWVLLLKTNAHPISKTGKSNKNQLPLTVHRAVFANLTKMTRKIVNFLIWSHFQFSSCHGICIYVCMFQKGKSKCRQFSSSFYSHSHAWRVLQFPLWELHDTKRCTYRMFFLQSTRAGQATNFYVASSDNTTMRQCFKTSVTR